MTPGTPTSIWSVVVDGDVDIRASNGRQSRWYQAAVAQRAGRISAAGAEHDVALGPVSGDSNDDIDAAYRDTYADTAYLEPMISDRASVGNGGQPRSAGI